MKKTPKKSQHTKAAVTAALMAVPLFGMPSKGLTQPGTASQTQIDPKDAMQKTSSRTYLKFKDYIEKHKEPAWIAGVGEGHTIYENSRGEMFYIDPSTGDMKTVSSDYFIKMQGNRKVFVLPHVLEKSGMKGSDPADITIKQNGSASMEKHHPPKDEVRLLGVDEAGNVIQQNSRGEKFYINTTTGDMVFVK